MGWDVTNDGLKAIFSRDIPELIGSELNALAVSFLASNGLTLADIDRFVCHPGGAKVLDALEAAFEIEPGSLVEARDVLREFGNMSAATVVFVLERVVAANARAAWNRALMTAMGPGFTAAFTFWKRERFA